ncbi:hypothetical protein EXIGLDRAFT_839705, partial [Exidia glandulosa HHB12029]
MERANENAQGSLGAERSCFVRWDELPPVDDEPPKNWVFLADVVENQTFMTTATYSIRDIAGRKLLLSVYPIKPTGSMFTIGRRGPDGRMQFDIPIGPRMEKVRNMQGGTMVAVKNCFAHWFMDGNVGVRLNEEDGDLDDFKHFPCTVAQFFDLNQRRKVAEDDDSAPCAKCTQPNAVKCCKCKTKYCSQPCQVERTCRVRQEQYCADKE